MKLYHVWLKVWCYSCFQRSGGLKKTVALELNTVNTQLSYLISHIIILKFEMVIYCKIN